MKQFRAPLSTKVHGTNGDYNRIPETRKIYET